MNRHHAVLVVLFLIVGGLAFFIAPAVLQPEPHLVIDLGLGAAVLVFMLSASILIASASAAYRQAENRSTAQLRRVSHSYDLAHRQFIRRLDHQIKNPLTGMQIEMANMLEARDEGERLQAEQNVHQALNRLSRLLRDLRKIADLDDPLSERRPVDMGPLVAEMVEAACSSPGRGAREVGVLIPEIPFPLPKVVGDRDLLGLAVYNLVDNALKYSRAQDKVEVRIREDGRSIHVEVADNGNGIPVEEHDHVFEELFRGSNAHGSSGSGLGLSIVRRIALLHRGDVSLRNHGEIENGTVFTLSLPLQTVANQTHPSALG